MNSDLIEMTNQEMIQTCGGDDLGSDLDKPWCFLAGAATVGAVVSVATGNVIGAAVFGFAVGFTGTGCYYSA